MIQHLYIDLQKKCITEVKFFMIYVHHLVILFTRWIPKEPFVSLGM